MPIYKSYQKPLTILLLLVLFELTIVTTPTTIITTENNQYYGPYPFMILGRNYFYAFADDLHQVEFNPNNLNASLHYSTTNHIDNEFNLTTDLIIYNTSKGQYKAFLLLAYTQEEDQYLFTDFILNITTQSTLETLIGVTGGIIGGHSQLVQLNGTCTSMFGFGSLAGLITVDNTSNNIQIQAQGMPYIHNEEFRIGFIFTLGKTLPVEATLTINTQVSNEVHTGYFKVTLSEVVNP